MTASCGPEGSGIVFTPVECRALNRHLAALIRAASDVSAELAALQATDLMYHGTSVDFAEPEFRGNTRFNQDGSIAWKGEAIFATSDPRVALHYTANRHTGVRTGIDLITYTDPTTPVALLLQGGESKAEALDRVYGSSHDGLGCRGYVHLLSRSKFVHEAGLGKMEMVTRCGDARVAKVTINRRQALANLEASGMVEVWWGPD